MFTAEDARNAVIEYEEYSRNCILTNLVNQEENAKALVAFETAIREKAANGFTQLKVKCSLPGEEYISDLEKYLKETEIKTILKYLGYNISIKNISVSFDEVEPSFFIISW